MIDARMADIRALYLGVLGREPDLGGLRRFAESSSSTREIRALMRASPERREVVVNVFRDMVGRDPSADEIDTWSAAPISPSLLAANLAYHEDRRARITATHRKLLGTDAGAAEAAASSLPLAAIEESLKNFARSLG